MTLEELMSEVYGRGFDDLRGNATEEARVKRWLNYAQREIADYAPWPFLEANKESTAPITFTDLGHVLSVTDLAHDEQLTYADRRELIGYDPNLSAVGAAERWYMEGEGTLKVYPADTSSKFLVRYVKVVTDLSAASDTPIIPTNYQELIVEGAVIRAYRNRDNYDAAKLVREEWRLGMELMNKALVKRNMDVERKVLRTGWPQDYV